jgi:hypothetical protein
MSSKSYFGKKIKFKDEGGKPQRGTIVDPDVLEQQETEDLYGPHITDEWHGANVQFLGKNFNEEDPAWYIIATGDGKSQGDYHIVSAKVVKTQMLKHELNPDTVKKFEELIDEL